MNDLQVIQGYISMQSTDKALQKVNDCIASFQNNRELLFIEAPLFAIWIVQFNMLHSNIRLSYNIHSNKILQSIDEKLVQSCQHITNSIVKYGDNGELYGIKLYLTDKLPSKVLLELTVKGKLSNQTAMYEFINENKQQNISITNETETTFTCEFSYSI